MNNSTCSFEGCEKIIASKGLCNGHYKQSLKGRALSPLTARSLTPEQRFAQKIEKTPSCWNWTGVKHRGYGAFKLNGKTHKAHRIAHEKWIGPIPEGMFVDHLCHNPSCVNPEHLRAVTPKHNSENRKGADSCNVSGVRGVHHRKRDGKWVVVIRHEGRNYYVGAYNDLRLAEESATQKRLELFTHNTVDRRNK